MFQLWYTAQITRQLEEGKSLEEIDVKLQPTVLKPLHDDG